MTREFRLPNFGIHSERTLTAYVNVRDKNQQQQNNLKVVCDFIFASNNNVKRETFISGDCFVIATLAHYIPDIGHSHGGWSEPNIEAFMKTHLFPQSSLLVDSTQIRNFANIALPEAINYVVFLQLPLANIDQSGLASPFVTAAKKAPPCIALGYTAGQTLSSKHVLLIDDLSFFNDVNEKTRVLALPHPVDRTSTTTSSLALVPSPTAIPIQITNLSDLGFDEADVIARSSTLMDYEQLAKLRVYILIADKMGHLLRTMPQKYSHMMELLRAVGEWVPDLSEDECGNILKCFFLNVMVMENMSVLLLFPREKAWLHDFFVPNWFSDIVWTAWLKDINAWIKFKEVNLVVIPSSLTTLLLYIKLRGLQ
jgi:hypothetical protein